MEDDIDDYQMEAKVVMRNQAKQWLTTGNDPELSPQII